MIPTNLHAMIYLTFGGLNEMSDILQKFLNAFPWNIFFLFL